MCCVSRWQFVVQCQFVVQFVTVCSCFCCCGVVVGERRGSSSPREVATVGDAATQTDANLEEDVVPSITAVVASVTGGCLVEAVEEGNVEVPDAKAKAARC